MSRRPITSSWVFWLIIGLCLLSVVLIAGGKLLGWETKDNGFMTFCQDSPTSGMVVYGFTGDEKKEPVCEQTEVLNLDVSHRPWKVLCNGDDEFSKAVKSAVNEFNARLDCPVLTMPGGVFEPDIIVSRGAVSSDSADNEGGSTTHMRANESWKVDIVIYNLVLSDELHRGLMHELGHALGLAHDQFRDSLMYKGTSGTARLTDGDRALLNKRYCHANR